MADTNSNKKQNFQPKRAADSPDVRLSKSLSYVLRHGAVKEKIPIRPDGYVALSNLLKHARFRGVSIEKVKELVAIDGKQRYTLTRGIVEFGEDDSIADANENWYIKANQGHSVDVSSLELAPILTAVECPTAIHGTSKKAWEVIRQAGLSKMKRNHIHLSVGLPGEKGVISGMFENRTRMTCLKFTEFICHTRDAEQFGRIYLY